jgi:hypothetical protein
MSFRRCLVGTLGLVLVFGGGGFRSTYGEIQYFTETGHYYELNTNYLEWFAAESFAEGRSFNGAAGHLATIGTQAENDFISAIFIAAHISGGPWLGGFQPTGSLEPAGGWQWITGEPWSFTNWWAGNEQWPEGEPNNVNGENQLVMYGPDGPSNGLGQWNDMDGRPGSRSYLPSMIEYDTPSVPEPSALILWSGLSAMGLVTAWRQKRTS